MTTEEYKKKFSISTLKEMLDIHKEMKTFHVKSKDQESINKEQAEIDAIESALGIAKKEEKEKFIASDLTETEQQLIQAIKTTALGREGMISDAMLRAGGAVESLVKRGIVFYIPHNPNHLIGGRMLGVVGEEYPETREYWNDYRTSLASNTMSFTQFKKEREKGTVMSAKEISNIIDTSLAFYTQEIENKNFLHTVQVGNFLNAKPDIDDMVVNRKLRGKELMEEILVEHMPKDFMDIRTPINPEWFEKIITRRIEFLKRKKANL